MRQGATVVLSGTKVEALESVRAELGARAFTAACQSFRHRLGRGAAQGGGRPRPARRIDILVNNAGITRDNLFLRMKDEEWDQVLAVNLTAAFRLSRAVLRGMMKKRWGRIIQITSVVGATGNPGQGNYAAAKAGLVGMSKSLAAEVASRNITVNAVAPGFIQTAMTEVLTDQQKEMIASRIPAGRMGMPGRNRRRRGLSGLRGSGLCDRRNHPDQWRDGDDMIVKIRYLTAKSGGSGSDYVTKPATHEAPNCVVPAVSPVPV